MITNTGKDIVSKYLIGQTPAYASYLALGCGSKPMKESHTITSAEAFGVDGVGGFVNQKALEFEMFRIPIISRGYISENGVSKIIFTGELPTTDKYSITEIGVYPASSNPAANIDSYGIFSFTSDEGWIYNNGSDAAIPSVSGTLDLSPSATPIFQTNVDNVTLNTETRKCRYEQLRMSGNAVYVRGDFSSVDVSGSTPTVSGNYLSLSTPNINLLKSNPEDELRLAFSVISASEVNNSIPDEVRVVVKFLTTSESEYATMTSVTSGGNLVAGGINTGNRYVVSKVALGSSDFDKTSAFSWASVNAVRVYVSTVNGSSSTSDFWIGLDGLRLENLSDTSPLYGLVAYTNLKNSEYSTVGSVTEYASPAIKPLNASGLVEFKFALDVS
jgi:hypothetical protein